jgi:hypothetical protein
MKSLIFAVVFFVLSVITSIGDTTNGVFYIDNPVSCHLVSQNGSIITNQLNGGQTYTVGNNLMEMSVSNKTTFYFAGGPMIEAGANSSISVNLYDLEVNNINSQPRTAEFGVHNLNLNLTSGEFSILYPNTNGSSLTVSTPFTSYEMHGGKYLVRITDLSIVVYIIDGSMEVHGDKRVDKTEKGKLIVAIPFSDPSSGVDDKVITSTKTLRPDETDRFASPVILAEKKWSNVRFFIVRGEVIGMWMK